MCYQVIVFRTFDTLNIKGPVVTFRYNQTGGYRFWSFRLDFHFKFKNDVENCLLKRKLK